MSNENQKAKSNAHFWKSFARKWFIILLVTLLFAGVSVGYSVAKIKPIYTASTSVVLKMTISDSGNVSTNTNNATLAKKNLPTVKECIESKKAASKANEYYNQINEKTGDNISKGAISVKHGDTSMIFTLSYSDLDKQSAVEKLSAVIETAPSILVNEIEAGSVDLVPVQNEFSVYSSSRKATVIVIGTILGLMVGVVAVLIICVLDNKIRNREELEELTGSNVIAYIQSE